MHEDLRGAPEVVRRCLFEEWTLEQRLVEQSHDGSREKLRELLERLNQKALENKEAFRDREARALMAPATFPVAEASGKPSASLNKLETMMAEALAAATSVSYTHLDVYKRQRTPFARQPRPGWFNGCGQAAAL